MSTRERVLEALSLAGDEGVSGQRLADELGVSRTAVAKHVSALESEGFRIEARAGRGYRLVAAPELSTPAGVRPLLTSGLWTRLEGGAETGSTNDDARALARAGAPEGTVVLAARQTAGRGRLGRSWSSPEGGAYLSAVLRPAVSPAEAATLALATGIAVARALESFGAAPLLKWPNDVLLGQGKAAGILLEMAAETDRVEWIVVGIGMNVVRPGGLRHERAAYLSDQAASATPAAVAARVLEELACVYALWLADGFAGLRADYDRRNSLKRCVVTVSDSGGEVRATGRAVEVDSDGRLVVETETGSLLRIVAGEVTLRS